MSVLCPRCHVENREQAKRCQACNEDLGRRPSAAAAAGRTITRLCPAGRHPMDPAWEVCPYCEADRKARREIPPPAAERRPAVAREIPIPAADLAPGSAPRRRQTEWQGEASQPPLPSPPATPPAPPPSSAPAAPGPRPRRRATAFAAPEAPSPVPASPAASSAATAATAPAPPAGRRVVAVLVTYTWQSEGQVFPVREGRSFVGSDPECDVALESDPHLSSRHATIFFRGRDFWIDDEKSMNGTFVDGESVEEKQKLRSYAQIKTGSTEWRFVRIEPAAEE